MISLIKVMVVGGRKNADFCEYRNKNGSYRRNYFICKKHDIHCVAVMEDDERNIGDTWICKRSNRFSENDSQNSI